MHENLVDVLVTFQGIKKNSKRWQMNEFPMNSYSVEILTFIVWNQTMFTTSLEDKASPMVSRRFDEDAEEKDTTGMSRRFI